MTKKLLIFLATAMLAAFTLAACGDDDDEETSAAETTSETTDSATSGGGETVVFEADPGGDLAWTETEVTAAAGDATIEMDNQSTTPHNVFVEDDNAELVAESETVTKSTTTVPAALEAGEYVFYCAVSGHREAGMEGTLTVE